MACKYFYDNKEYTFDEFASLLENGLADELVAKNVLSSSGVYNKKAPVDNMPGAITINSSNADVNVGKGSNVVTKIVRQSQRMVKAMSKLAPNLSFTVHATEDSWNQLREQMLSNGVDITGMDGFYDPNTDQIHLNVPMMEKLGRLNTAYHEGYHPLTNALFNSRPDLRGAMYDQMVIMSEDQTLPKEFRDQVKECIAFGNSYDVEKYGKESPLNEAIVEFLSRVSNGQIQIDGKNKTMMDHIRIFLNNLAGMFNIGVMMGNKEYTVDNLLDFARAMDFAIKQGVAVEFNPRNVPVFNSQDNLEIENGDVITSGYYPQTKAIQASFTPMDINWEYANLPSNIQMAVPSNRETLANTLKKSGGAAVFINSDGTGVGVISEDKYIDGGISYSFFKDNIDNEIGFAASEDSKIKNFYKAVRHAAEVRDKTNPEFKGMPVAVYVTVQSAGSTIGNYHGAEFMLDNIKEAIGKRKLNATELKKAFDYATKATIKARLVKSNGKETKAIKSYNQFLVDLKSIKSGDLVNELEKYLKKESFAFRLDILGNIIPNINVKSKREISDFQNKLKELNIDLPSFYDKYLDKNILNSLKGDTPGEKYKDNGFAMTGFYVDPYMTEGEYVNKSNVDKFKHKQFNSAFHGTNPFILNGKYYVNHFFDEARFLDSRTKGAFIPVSVSAAGSMYPRTWNSEDFNEIIERAERLTIMPSLAGEFVDKLNETKESDPKQYWSVDNVSLEDAKQGTVIKTEAGYGFVSQDGDIKGVFKANKESAEKTGDEVLKKAVKAGGIKLDNFDGYLTKIYERNGFRIASRIPFNEDYAPEGWEKEAHGTPDVVAMVYDPYKQLDIEEKRFDDYMEGIDYRDSFVGLAYGNAITNGDMPPRIDARPDDLVSASPIVYDMTEDGNGNYVFYTDKVSENNADVNEDGVLELTTEKKGIQPSMVKVPYESTYPLDTNPLGLKINIQPSIIGEKGAERLETASRNMNNLLVAKKMKSQKKSKQAIKTATGWELGADGLWRMEVTDSKFKYDNFKLNRIIEKAINEEFTYKLLPDVISNKDLFDAYPYLRDVSVAFGKTGWVRFSPTSRYNMSPTTAAVYISAGPGHQHIIINSEVLKEKGAENILSYIDHEIQHYIQEQEGFTQGSSPKEEFDIITSKIDDKIFSDSSKPLERRLAKRLNEISTERNSLMSNLNEENKQRSSDLHKERLAIYDKYATDILKIGSTYERAYKNYNNKYGEIEARNVETRRQIPFEERANLLLEATQDVKNKDAIFTANDKKVISALETYANKSILQQAKNLGFAAVVNKDMEGNAVVMSDTVMPAEPMGDTQHLPNKQAIQPSLGWAGSKGVQQVEVGKIGMSQPAPVNPMPGNVRELSNKQQSAFNNFTRMYLSATQGNSQAAKSLQETFKGEESYVVEQISKDAIQLSKQIKEFVNSEAAKANGLKEKTINTIVNRARLGETDPRTGVKYVDMLPQDLAESVVQARQNIITLQEALLRSGLLPSEIQAVIASTIGSYTKTSYYAFELRKKKGFFSLFTKQKTSPWFESVPKDVRDKAKGIFTAMAMNGTLDNGFNLVLEDYRKNYEEPYLALLAADPLMQSNATQQAATAMNNKLAEVNKKAGEFADAVMRKIEDVNQSGDVNFTIGGSVVSMKDYIEKNPALPKEIKEYLGEINDPAINFRLTAMKLTRMLYNHQMGAQFKNLGLQSGDVVPASEPTPAGWIKLGEITKGDSKKIKGGALDEMDAVNKYGPLKGCSITPAMYNLLFDTPIEGNLYYKFITSNVKKFKTIYSPSTQIKNVYGYLYFGMASGAIPEAIYYSPRIVSGAYNQINTPAGFMGYWNNMFSEAKKRGINTSLELEEINRIGKELSENKELLASLKGSTNPAQTIYQTFTDALNKVENFSKKGMMLGDAIPKTIMFEIFRNTNAVILNNTSYYELDARQKEIADEMAARKVKLTTVTDTRTIKAIDLIQRKMGIFGTFPRFMSESIRNFVNAHLLVANPGMLHEGLTLSDNPTKDAEMKKQMDIKTRASGISGLAGYYGLMSLLRAAMGFGDDDDEKVSVSEIPNGIKELSQIMNKPEGTLTQNEALRRLLPEYDKFASLSFKVNKDGTVEYRNESSVDPFNIFPQAYRSFIYADNIASGVGSAALQVAMPVLGWEILFGSALEVINNENSKGVEIHKNFDDFASKRIDDIAYILKKAGPGIATSTMRYADLVESGKREGTATGYLQFITTEGVQGRVSTAEVESKLRSKVKEINDMWIADQRKYSGDFYKTKSVEDRDLVNKQRDENAKMFAYELNQLVEAGYALGLDNRQVKQVFKDARVSKKVRNASMRGGSYIDNLNINDIKED
jgi:predicted SprT family Zn-dependent metalloprotease